jgi:ABC-type glycerol-3-phosphate transport system permease component
MSVGPGSTSLLSPARPWDARVLVPLMLLLGNVRPRFGRGRRQNERLYPLTLGLYTWNSTVTRSPELRIFVIVGALLSIVPLIIAFVSLQRFWRSGLAAGGVK